MLIKIINEFAFSRISDKHRQKSRLYIGEIHEVQKKGDFYYSSDGWGIWEKHAELIPEKTRKVTVKTLRSYFSHEIRQNAAQWKLSGSILTGTLSLSGDFTADGSKTTIPREWFTILGEEPPFPPSPQKGKSLAEEILERFSFLDG